MTNQMAKLIRSYILKRAEDKPSGLEKDLAKVLKSVKTDEERSGKEQETSEERAAIRAWLTSAAKRAKQIQLVTHAIKFTHSAAKGSSILSRATMSTTDCRFLLTALLRQPKTDFDGNAAAHDVARLLRLEVAGESLLDQLANGDASALAEFAADPRELEDWVNGFRLAVETREPSTHTLAKQVYFPVGDGEYHLLSPLFSSSLAGAAAERVTESRFGEKNKAAREARAAGRQHDDSVIYFPGIAVQEFGGSKPRNVSLLNHDRRGSMQLFRSCPPDWESTQKPPLKVVSVFVGRVMGRQVNQAVSELKRFLISAAKRPSNIDLREKRAALADEIADEVLSFSVNIQQLPGGWSSLPECNLNRAEQIWLDLGRAAEDPQFLADRQEGSWKDTVVKNFAAWLNQQLETSETVFGDPEFNEWRDVITNRMRFNLDAVEV